MTQEVRLRTKIAVLIARLWNSIHRRLRSETLFAELQLFILLRNQSISLSVNQSINQSFNSGN